MSNLGAFSGSKNPPWGRASVGNSSNNLVNQPNSLQQQLMNQNTLNNMNSGGMVQFQQQHQQVFQNAMGMQQQNLNLSLQQMGNPSVAMGASLSSQLATNQLFQQVGAVTYPNPRALNPNAFQTQSIPTVSQIQPSANTSAKQRVFTGTVTKVHDNFGFVDEDVFFQTSACVKGSNPMVGDRVLVEATYNPSMPFKWNATRIQVLPMTNQSSSCRTSSGQKTNTYNAVPPPSEGSNLFGKGQRSKNSIGGRGRERSRERERDDEESERKKRREERVREREKEERKSPIRRRSRTPKSRRRSRIVPRYMVQIPKINLDLRDTGVLEIRRRYANLYVPSDFFSSYFRWVDAFPPNKPFSVNKPCSFHIMSKDIDPVIENNSILEPPDADYLFSAKVMLMSVPGIEDMYQRCCALAEEKEKRDRDSEEKDFVHPTRLINFLVGLRGKNETMAVGGPWSPSLDGENPYQDPTVLIKTAIRSCHALTGIDLSACTQWYRFLELYYRRSESTHKGKAVPARVETVVLFLPDVWSCLPTRLEWDGLQLNYRKQLEHRLKADQDVDDQATADEKEEESTSDKLEPTHFSQLDPKSMVVSALRQELKARSINSKGLKSQLVARLTKTLKLESEKSDDVSKETPSETELEIVEEKRMETEEKKLDEKEKAQLEKRYTLPEQQHILVHPSRIAKSGKFDCTVMSLSLLLDYRPEDTKEHSFEVSLFAELFNEMLMRDFGFNIYKALYELPEKMKDKDEKKKKDDKKSDDDKKRDDDKRKDDDRSDDTEKRDEKRDRKSEDKKSDKAEDKKRDSRKYEVKCDNNDSEDEEEYEEDENKEKKKSDKDKKKRDKPKMFTKDKHLLLSFVYFDQTHCGYIFEKDIEDLLYTLGLSLSRAQVRKLVGKVISRDSLHYRKLTDKPKEEDFIVIDDSEKDVNLQELALGNKNLLPIFQTDSGLLNKMRNDDKASGSDEGLVMFHGALVDVTKLMAQLERNDKARLETEERMVDLKSENIKLVEKNSKFNSMIKSLNVELKECKDKLKNSEDSVSKLTVSTRLFQSALIEIRDKIDPLLKSTSKDESNHHKKEKENIDKDKKYEECKTRWEKEICKGEYLDVDMNEKD